jgi:hypothetical protein
MPAFNAPYWLRVIRFFERRGFIQNGLTVPFLIGSRKYLQTADAHYNVERLLFEFYNSQVPLTILFCNNINEFVVGSMDAETTKLMEDGKVSYHHFGKLFCVDSSIETQDINSLTKSFIERYSKLIDKELYSVIHGIWQVFSDMDKARLEQLFWEEKAASATYYRERDQIEEMITKLHTEGNLTSLSCQWHVNLSDINFFDLNNSEIFELLRDGLEIIDVVSIQKLIEAMPEEWLDLFEDRQLFHDDLGASNIANVIQHWRDGQKLIPPIITLMDNNEEVYPADGKHRVNVAYFFNADTIPIIVPKSQKDRIIELLN